MNKDTNPCFHRSELLLGREVMDSLAEIHVVLFGIGGVGSWCAEALVRTGLRKITIVDHDIVCDTNINRQCHATSENIGRAKVEELKNRFLSINPGAAIYALQKEYTHETAPEIDLTEYDYILDAIDSVPSKVELIDNALKIKKTIFSSMGAARKRHPSKIKVSSIWKTSGCPLARAVRKGLRKHGTEGDFLCVYSDEQAVHRNPRENESGRVAAGGPEVQGYTAKGNDASAVNGSLVHITGTFGFYLAGLVIDDIMGSRYRKKG